MGTGTVLMHARPALGAVGLTEGRHPLDYDSTDLSNPAFLCFDRSVDSMSTALLAA
jgi:hypothetical protein